ncbi:CRAL-TRIO domain-containing protein [Hyaloraphidium curvatum]|nr:CRAL-TRIO domain-containing protein [Hyaloraphidium curvatum]
MSGYLEDLSTSQKEALDALRLNLANSLSSLQLGTDYENLWGVPLAGIDGEPTDAQKRVLLKFLRAREFDVEAALAMAENVLRWRKSFRIHELMKEKFDPAFDKLGFLQDKPDRKGHPVTWNLYAGIDTATIFRNGTDDFIRWRIQLMEKAVALLDFNTPIETVTQIHSYEGVSMFSVDSNIRAVSKQIITIFSDNYPEFLERKLFLHVPWLMSFLYSIFSSFTTARTRAKFTMTSASDVKATLEELIAPENLPAIYAKSH